jgi:hypothetical protein
VVIGLKAQRLAFRCEPATAAPLSRLTTMTHNASPGLTSLGPQPPHNPPNRRYFAWPERFDRSFATRGKGVQIPQLDQIPWSGRFREAPFSRRSVDSRSCGPTDGPQVGVSKHLILCEVLPTTPRLMESPQVEREGSECQFDRLAFVAVATIQCLPRGCNSFEDVLQVFH